MRQDGLLSHVRKLLDPAIVTDSDYRHSFVEGIMESRMCVCQ